MSENIPAPESRERMAELEARAVTAEAALRAVLTKALRNAREDRRADGTGKRGA